MNTATKLFKTFAVLLDAHNRYRAGKERKVTIKRVLVKDDGHQLIEQVSSRQAALRKVDETLALPDSRQPKTESLETEEKAWLDYVKREKSHS